jgi:hypothetical protein
MMKSNALKFNIIIVRGLFNMMSQRLRYVRESYHFIRLLFDRRIIECNKHAGGECVVRRCHRRAYEIENMKTKKLRC